MTVSTRAYAEPSPLVTGLTRSPSRRVALAASLLLAACALALAEAAVPPLVVVPWLKLGLSNVAIVAALLLADVRMAAVVSAGRLIIVGLATGTLASPAFVMAAIAAAVSLAVMALLHRSTGGLSAVGLSAAGSAAHVAAQFATAAVVLGSSSVLVLAPPSVLAAIILGVATGSLAGIIVSRVTVRA